jgi:hypothetical protein
MKHSYLHLAFVMVKSAELFMAIIEMYVNSYFQEEAILLSGLKDDDRLLNVLSPWGQVWFVPICECLARLQ